MEKIGSQKGELLEQPKVKEEQVSNAKVNAVAFVIFASIGTILAAGCCLSVTELQLQIGAATIFSLALTQLVATLVPLRSRTQALKEQKEKIHSLEAEKARLNGELQNKQEVILTHINSGEGLLLELQQKQEALTVLEAKLQEINDFKNMQEDINWYKEALEEANKRIDEFSAQRIRYLADLETAETNLKAFQEEDQVQQPESPNAQSGVELSSSRRMLLAEADVALSRARTVLEKENPKPNNVTPSFKASFGTHSPANSFPSWTAFDLFSRLEESAPSPKKGAFSGPSSEEPSGAVFAFAMKLEEGRSQT